jgi:hypothetical protein
VVRFSDRLRLGGPALPQEDRSPLGKPAPQDPRDGLALILYEHSLVVAFSALFFGSAALHTLRGAKAFNEEQIQHGEATISAWRYLTTTQFWFESMRNWQSEFIAVADYRVVDSDEPF